MFDSSMVNEPSGFEPLKFYYILIIEKHKVYFLFKQSFICLCLHYVSNIPESNGKHRIIQDVL